MSNFTGYLPVYLRNPVENGAFMFRHQRIISFFPIKNKFSLVKLLENFSKGFLFCWNVSLVLDPADVKLYRVSHFYVDLVRISVYGKVLCSAT